MAALESLVSLRQLRYFVCVVEQKGFTPAAAILHVAQPSLSRQIAQLEAAIAGLTWQPLDTPYREGGWTVRQVVHHVADSHMNSYIRFKWTLTETSPLIKAYDEKEWAKTPEITADPTLSVALLKALHAKWVLLMKGLTEQDWNKHFVHPDGRNLKLNHTLGLYAWHGDHHLAHITRLRERNGW